MATGKTVVGKALAKYLGCEFVDLDDLIEKKENMRIVDIFAKRGESYFRKVEKQIAKDISVKSDFVVACGGGLVVDPDNVENLKNSGVIICLVATPDTILKRASGTEQRPLLNVEEPKQRITELLKKRDEFYKKADHEIDTTNLSVQDVVNRIAEIIDIK